MTTFDTPTDEPHGIGGTLVLELGPLGALAHGTTTLEDSERSR